MTRFIKAGPLSQWSLGPLFLAVASGFLWLEHRRPLRRPTQPKRDRLVTNALMSGVAAATLRLTLLPAALSFADYVQNHRWGLFHLVTLPFALHAALALLMFDYTLFIWHWLNHRAPFLWRFHLVHHTDLDLDVLTATRFHFGELLLSVPYRLAQILIIGASPFMAILFETLVMMQTLFHHSNVQLPLGVERRLNWILVTPRMHGIHHSVIEPETNSNWSNIFSWWDRLHGTLRLEVPQSEITIGLPSYRDPHELGFVSLMRLPFTRQRAAWPLPDGRRVPSLPPPH